MSDFSKRLVKTREERGMSASDLARLAGVTPTAVWNWEKNGVQPRRDALATIARVLGVSQEFLLAGTGGGRALATDVPAIISDAEARVAAATGFQRSRVKLKLEVLPE